MSEEPRLYPVPGFTGYGYDVDWNVFNLSTGRACKSYLNKEGRAAWNLNRDGKQATIFRSAIVCTHYHGPRPAGKLALHNNGNPSEDTKENLRWGTQKENMADRKAHGTFTPLKGEKHGRAKLTEADVLAIRASTASRRSDALKWGVSLGTIDHIKTRIIWRHI